MKMQSSPLRHGQVLADNNTEAYATGLAEFVLVAI